MASVRPISRSPHSVYGKRDHLVAALLAVIGYRNGDARGGLIAAGVILGAIVVCGGRVLLN